jgi:hypothetical protein
MIGSTLGAGIGCEALDLLFALIVGAAACCAGMALLLKPTTNETFRRWLSLGRKPLPVLSYSPGLKLYVRLAGGGLALLSGLVVWAVAGELISLFSQSGS